MKTLSVRLLAILMVGWAGVTPAAPAGKTLREQRQALLEQKVELLQASLEWTQKLVDLGRVGAGEFQEARIALFQAQLAAAANAQNREELHTLRQQQVQQLQASLEWTQKLVDVGRAGPAELHEARLALVTAQLAAASDAAERAKLYTKLIAVLEQRCRLVEAGFRAGRVQEMAVLDAKLKVLQARIDQESDAAGKARQGDPANH